LKYNPNYNSRLNISLLAELYDHGRCPHYEDCDYGRSPILTKKLSKKFHDKFVNSTIDVITHQILPH